MNKFNFFPFSLWLTLKDEANEREKKPLIEDVATRKGKKKLFDFE
jgi:hypothetical protein